MGIGNQRGGEIAMIVVFKDSTLVFKDPLAEGLYVLISKFTWLKYSFMILIDTNYELVSIYVDKVFPQVDALGYIMSK